MSALTPVPTKDHARAHRPERSWYAFAARLLPGKTSAGRWVDLGCGAGEMLELATERGLNGWGLDRVHSSAILSSAEGRCTLVADMERSLPFADGSLDGAVLVETIEHIVRAEQLIDEVARVLRPGGWLVLTTPNVAHLNYRVRALTGHAPKQEGYHLRFFTRRTLARLVRERGFRVDGYASYGRLPLLGRLLGHRAPPFVVPRAFEGILAKHFVWRLTRAGS